jgi:hypothetical protein
MGEWFEWNVADTSPKFKPELVNKGLPLNKKMTIILT